jgi:hypothetical protein
MPGPKPKAPIIFRDIYLAVGRLRAISTTQQQHDVILNLFKGLNTVEPLWGDERAFVGTVTPTNPSVETTERISMDEMNAIKQQAREAFQRGEPVESNPYINLRGYIWSTEWSNHA